MNTTPVQIDLEKLKAEVEGMSVEDLESQLLKVKVRQKKQQAKMQGSESHKKYQKLQQEKRKALIAKAKALGIYDKINDQAKAQADAELTAEAAENPEVDETEEVEA